MAEPLTRSIAADCLTPVSAFLRLRRGTKGVARMALLESVEGGERLARYSTIGLEPYARVFLSKGTLTVEALDAEGRVTETRAEMSQDPIAELGRKLLAEKLSAKTSFPFAGGALGYLAYDAIQHVEPVKIQTEKTGVYDANFMLFRKVVVFDHVARSVTLVCTDTVSDRAQRERALDTLAERLAAPTPEESREAQRAPTSFAARRGPKVYGDGVSQLKQAIRRGDIFQGVLSEQFSAPIGDNEDRFDIYRRLRAVSPAPHLYFLDFGDEVLMGASPERLVSVDDKGVVETCPIAGTRPRGRNDAEDARFEAQLLDSVKERAEHVMLVDLGRNDVGRVAKPGTVKVVEYMQVHRFSHVMHLVSRVQGQLAKTKSAWDALLAAFPAGTLTGAPKIRAMQLLADIETVSRGPYGGAVVSLDVNGRLDSCIVIRSLFVRDGRVRVQAGAGIVADSQAPREFAEVQAKSRAPRLAMGDA